MALVYNALRTPDGTIIQSRSVHDFVCHTDTITGKQVCVDGGLDYLRRIGDFASCQDLSLEDSAPHEQIREVVSWGSYGPAGDQPLRYILIKDLSDDHLSKILAYPKVSQRFIAIMQREQEHRCQTQSL